jgi:hypothetical protein
MRNVVPRSSRRKINPITPTQNQEKLAPPKPRRWQTAALKTFQPKLKNYFQPLSQYTHHEEIDMARDKEQAAASMRVRMGMIRSGISVTSSITPTPPMSGRGGGRGGGTGRGNSNRSNKEKNSEVEVNYKTRVLPTDTNEMEENTMETTTTNKETVAMEETLPTVSNITDEMKDGEEEMDEDDNGLDPIMIKGIPSKIKNSLQTSNGPRIYRKT